MKLNNLQQGDTVVHGRAARQPGNGRAFKRRANPQLTFTQEVTAIQDNYITHAVACARDQRESWSSHTAVVAGLLTIQVESLSYLSFSLRAK